MLKKRIKIKWEKTSKTTYLSSHDVVVTKTTAYLPSLSGKFTKKQLTNIFNECTSALKKMAYIK